MEIMASMIRSWKMAVVCVGFMLATGSYITPTGAQDDQSPVSSASRPAPTLPLTNAIENSSVIIGDGIRTPSDIGVAGTASPTPPLRFESPKDQTDIFPQTTPVPSASSSDPEGFSSADPTLLEQPGIFKK